MDHMTACCTGTNRKNGCMQSSLNLPPLLYLSHEREP